MHMHNFRFLLCYTVLYTKVIDVVGDQLGKKGAVTIDSNFIDDLGADSLDTIELIMSLEEEFGVRSSEDYRA